MQLYKFIPMTGACCFSLLLAAQEKYEWKEARSAGFTYKYVTNDPMKARFYKLKNGLTVILSVNKKEPRIQTLFGTRAGSNNDPKDHTGLAHYLEHLLFKGTDQYGSLNWSKENVYIKRIEQLYDEYNHFPLNDTAARKAKYHEIDSVSGIAATYAIANEYDKMMASMGAQGTNAHTWVEETVYEEDIPSNAIDKYLSVQAERFRNPVFRLFHTELEAVYEEKNRGLDNDGRKMYEVMLAALFPTHNYGQQSTIGTVEHLKNPSLKAIRTFYNSYYVPNNMAIVMAGDFDPDEVVKKIDEKFAYWQPKPVQEYKPAPESPIATPVVKEVYGPSAEYVQIGYRMPGALDVPSSVLLTVASQILSNGKAGLLDLNLNKQQKLLGAGASVISWKDYSVFTLSGNAKQAQSLDEVKDLLLGQVEVLKQGAFDDALIKAIVNNFKFQELQGLQNNANRASSLMDGFIKHKGENWHSDVAFLEAMSKVTKQQVVDFANQYFQSNYVLLYKRKGEDKSMLKIEKPPITPVAVNRGAQSDFVKKIAALPATRVKPQWLNFDRDIQKGKLGNAKMLYVQNKENSIFRLYYRFEMGSRNSKLLPLAAQYLQYLGTDQYSAEQISKEFYNIACSFNITATPEITTISITGLQENFDRAVSLFDQLLTRCKADEAALTQLKGRLMKSRANNKLNKGAIMQGLVSYAMYGPHNPFNHQLSDAELNALKAAELVKLLHNLPHYRHWVIYYGPQTMAAMAAKVKKLHVFPARFTPYPPSYAFKKTYQTNNKVLFAHYDMVQAEINWVRNAAQYDPRKEAIVDLFNNYFGAGSMSNIVFQTIRESKALAYSTYAYYARPAKKEDQYAVIAYVGSQADKLHEAIGSMNELLNELPRAEKVFETAKESVKNEIETQRITQDGIIFSYLSARRLGLHYDIRKQEYAMINKLRFEDVKKFHAANIAKKPYTYCIVAAENRIRKNELKQYGQLTKLSLEQIFGY